MKEGVDLVNHAGNALHEIVESIKGVASVIADIATASAEQSIGIEQVNKTLVEMDEVTQQNSALVEENAATAKKLEDQAATMNERVGRCHVGHVAPANQTMRAPARPAAPPTRSQPMRRMRSA